MIYIDLTYDENLDIDFDVYKVRNILLAINSNKACGPDAIHGKISKNCAVSLAHPIFRSFTLSYNSGNITGY